ncbi:mfs multidrug transporter [Moniliophthora roreri]|uniref:Uncharacterized protein n=1 Tax=Moniliophthora roreri TaxID=221103 RepID=A0A0W0FXG3_MONRR|nr:mfs multidrug transporter [Moniliophthora roreri]
MESGRPVTPAIEEAPYADEKDNFEVEPAELTHAEVDRPRRSRFVGRWFRIGVATLILGYHEYFT